LVRRKRKHESAARRAAAATVAPQPEQLVSATLPATHFRRVLVVAAGLTTCWLIGLGTLAGLTANPVTLNQAQIRQADFVLTGRVVDVTVGTAIIEQAWKVDDLPNQIIIDNLAETKAENGEHYLLALSHGQDGSYEVTRARLPQRSHHEPPQFTLPLIYPTTDETTAQLKQILDQ